MIFLKTALCKKDALYKSSSGEGDDLCWTLPPFS